VGRLVYLNGAPGVGKLTIARALACGWQARVLDNHSIYNVAFALTDFRTPAFYEAVRAVRAAAFEQVLRVPVDENIILTSADFLDSEWGRENWGAIQKLAEERDWPLYSVVLRCEPAEHKARIISAEREARGKLREAGTVDLYTTRPLAGTDGCSSLELDVTHMTPDDAASEIKDWVRGRQ